MAQVLLCYGIFTHTLLLILPQSPVLPHCRTFSLLSSVLMTHILCFKRCLSPFMNVCQVPSGLSRSLEKQKELPIPGVSSMLQQSLNHCIWPRLCTVHAFPFAPSNSSRAGTFLFVGEEDLVQCLVQ